MSTRILAGAVASDLVAGQFAALLDAVKSLQCRDLAKVRAGEAATGVDWLVEPSLEGCLGVTTFVRRGSNCQGVARELGGNLGAAEAALARARY